jgi:hypothetical protein
MQHYPAEEFVPYPLPLNIPKRYLEYFLPTDFKLLSHLILHASILSNFTGFGKLSLCISV